MRIVSLDTDTLTAGDLDFGPIKKLAPVSFFNILPYERTAEAVGSAEILLCNKALIDAPLMRKCTALKYVGLYATGYNNVDLDEASRRGITVCNAPGYSTDSVAQHVFAFILAHAVNTAKYDASVHAGDWVRSPAFSYFPYPVTEIAGKTLGIFGFGTIGRAVAKIADAFGMRVIVCVRDPAKRGAYEAVSCERLFRESDYLTFHCPLTELTRGLVNRRTLSLMKPSAVLINTSRGGVVNEADLADALERGVIAAAAVDVLSAEPMAADNPLLSARNCVITPHIAWASIEARRRLIILVASNIEAYLSGKPKNVVNRIGG